MFSVSDIATITSYLKQTGVTVAVGSAINLALTLLWALRWRSGLRFLGLRTSYLQALEAITSSFPIGTVLPGNKAAQEAFRVAYLRAPSSERGKVISATTMEWVSEGLVLSALVLVAIILRSPLVTFGLVSYAQVEKARPQGALRRAINDLVNDLKLLASSKRMMTVYIGTSTLIVLLDMFKVTYMLVLLGYVPPVIDAVILYIVLRLSSLAPTPAGAGVFEAGAFAALTLIGAPADIAALYIIAIRIVDTLIPAGVGLVVLTVTGGLRILSGARRRLSYGKP
ncbi:MAG: lysylphosphatidylglycerol synthase transmembrane domain-containing protein [Acidilobus sp.]